MKFAAGPWRAIQREAARVEGSHPCVGHLAWCPLEPGLERGGTELLAMQTVVGIVALGGRALDQLAVGQRDVNASVVKSGTW